MRGVWRDLARSGWKASVTSCTPVALVRKESCSFCFVEVFSGKVAMPALLTRASRLGVRSVFVVVA